MTSLLEQLASISVPQADNPTLVREGHKRLETLLIETPDETLQSCMTHPHIIPLLDCIFGHSPYLTILTLSDLSFTHQLLTSDPQTLFTTLLDELSQKQSVTTTEWMQYLRQLKCRVALLTAIMDITNLWDLSQVTGSLSDFADLATYKATDFLLSQAREKGSVEYQGNRSGLVIIALGKLGSHALNYSSDIDIAIFYNPELVTYKGRGTIQQFFVKLTHQLVEMLSDRTKDGYVFRVDLRIRPDPLSMPLAIQVQTAITYYETVGQNWERAALIKARYIAGDKEETNKFLDRLGPFIWRKYLDFAAIQDIHSIKRQIDSKYGVSAKELYGYNIKLGRGGIREIEFYCQTQQLIYGGKQPHLRNKSTVETLTLLAKAGYVQKETAEALQHIYRFLRNVEHRLQMIDDHQTHTLPKDNEGMHPFALFMGFETTDSFTNTLSNALSVVQMHYAKLFQQAKPLSHEGNLVFTGAEPDPDTLNTLRQFGYQHPATLWGMISGWHYGRYRALRSAKSREILTELVPVLLESFASVEDSDEAIVQFDRLLAKIPSSVQLFSLLQAQPTIMPLLAELLGNYPKLSEYLRKHPHLIEYIVMTDTDRSFPTKQQLTHQLQKLLSPISDYETILDLIRQWTHEKQFLVGIQLIRQSISPKVTRQYLSDIASVMLEVLYGEVLSMFESRRGTIDEGRFAIIALGNLGSESLSFGSDLDLLFIYDAKEDSVASGEGTLEATDYYKRLARRIYSAITSPTKEGILYELDTRLGPQGDTSLLASSLASFKAYYATSAWSWEYMALTKARIITGENSFTPVLHTTIKSLLRHYPQDPSTLKQDVVSMRNKIDEEFYTANPWNVKYIRGGIIDIEFITAYLQLLYGSDNPDILYPHCASALRKLGEHQLLKQETVQELVESWIFLQDIRTLSQLTHRDITSTTNLPTHLQSIVLKHVGEKDFHAARKKLIEVETRCYEAFTSLLIYK